MQKNLKFTVDVDDYLKFQKYKDLVSTSHGRSLDNSTVFCIMLDFFDLKFQNGKKNLTEEVI